MARMPLCLHYASLVSILASMAQGARQAGEMPRPHANVKGAFVPLEISKQMLQHALLS